MQQRDFVLLIAIITLALFAAWIDFGNPVINISLGPIQVSQAITVHEGLDLQGGTHALLEADVPLDQPVKADEMDAAKAIVENRINGLGVTEPLIQLQGDRRIVVELPGIKDPDQAIKTFGQTGELEFLDAGATFLSVGTIVKTTTFVPPVPGVTPTNTATATLPPTATANPTPAGTATPGPTPTPLPTPTPEEPVYSTVMTGKYLSNVAVGLDEVGKPEINFTLTSEGTKIFGDFTSKNVGRFLAIALDKRIISCPRIQSAITEGRGRITGEFKLEEAQSLMIQLKYGSLPIPLKVVETRNVGPTLGQDSVQKSIVAGQIGLLIVVLFMLLYYRLPGFLANLALGVYALVVFALFKTIPVVLTLPGIAGFILSVGMAVDANILIFERMKEELRAGKMLGTSIEAGFLRAWPSIRDSNFSTLITCGILFWFGSFFGASIVKGFAFTLAIGVLVSMFTAILVTRTFLRLVMGMDITRNHWWFGV
jgi:preprotein translocase subunit SecD